MARYVVTGGAGFIGSHLVDALLAEGHAVRVVDDLSTGRLANLDPRVDFLPGDVADPALMPRAIAGTDGCFHLAPATSVARGTEGWPGTHRGIPTGMSIVLGAASLAGRVPVVYASSAAIYGDQGPGQIAESATPRPRSAHGADQLGSELRAAVGFRMHGVPTLGLRLFNVYGPRQDPASPYFGVVRVFAARIAAGLPLTIDGDGRQTRDFIYVTDVARQLRAGMARLRREPEASVFNACTGQATSVLALAQALAGVVGRAARVGFGLPRPGDPPCLVGNPGRARAALGVSADTRLLDGLARMLADAPESASERLLSLVA